MGKRQEKFEDYEGFVEKFKPRKTTDDCMTPAPVYEAICRWVSENITPLDGVPIVRPFWPGGDYENYDYPEGCIVLDNPPFSILAKIRRFYHARGIRYFLFAPTLTMASAKEIDETYIVCHADITYENGATVPTSFITNLPCNDIRVWCAGGLSKVIEDADKARRPVAVIPRYAYPANVVTPALLQKIAKRGIDLRIPKNECKPCSRLDSQKEAGKSMFGNGWLISERMAAERMAAERMVAERMVAEEVTVWPLSDRERDIIHSLG